jgi:hypothetical protein
MAEVIVGLILSASSADEANQKLQLLHTVDPLSDRHLRHLRDNILSNRVLHETGHFFFRDLNKLLESRGLGAVSRVTGVSGPLDDDEIPF